MIKSFGQELYEDGEFCSMNIKPMEEISLLKAAYSTLTGEVCKKYEISSSEFDILLFLANNPLYDTAAKIVEMRHLAKSHVSVLSSRLEESGYITRFYVAGNHKTVHMRLTEKAIPIVTDGQKAQRDFFEMLFKGISEEQMAATRAVFDAIHDNAESFLNSRT